MVKGLKQQFAESFVFDREEWQHLQFQPVIEGSIQLRSHTNREHKDLITYIEGIDYKVDYQNALIARTANSRLPDWSQHALSGLNPFNHTLFPDFSNLVYTVFGDYEYEQNELAADLIVKPDDKVKLAKVKEKLNNGQEVTFVVYGDSISTGGEASEEQYTYYGRFAAHLNELHPQGRITIINKAIGGEASDGGASRVYEDVVPFSPDLVTIGYGMNDQNKFDYGNTVALPNYESNIRIIIEAIQSSCDADIILVTPCEPNPKWQHTSGMIKEYAELLIKLGAEYGIGVADANTIWRQALSAGKTPESLLLNNINHPNDYGHWLYYRAFQSLL